MKRDQPRDASNAELSTATGEGESARDALDRMWVMVHRELRDVAHRKLAMERVGHTLSTTALVHEVYLKLAKQRTVSWEDRRHFFALAAQAMRRILIDYARRHKHMREQLCYDSVDPEGSGGPTAVHLAAAQRSDELLALDEALERLASVDERLCRVVECRFFAGFSDQETADTLGVTVRTVGRDWAKAKEWLFRELHQPAKADDRY